MYLKKAKLLKIKLAALTAFMKNVGTIGRELADNETREGYRKIYKDIKETLADPNLEIYAPGISSGSSLGGDGLLWGQHQVQIINSGNRLISYLEAVLASASPSSHQSPKKIAAPANIFISHGRESEALNLLRNSISAIGQIPLIVMEESRLGKSLHDKVLTYMRRCTVGIILATGDDELKGSEYLQPRQNVIHEIGLAQEILTNRITYLLEEGTEFPSNITPKVYEPFTKDNLSKAFIAIVRDLKAFGIL